MSDRLALSEFVSIWKDYSGTEIAGGQDFLRGLLSVYGVTYKPGCLFEQHPVRVPVREHMAGPTFTTERVDMYLPRVCLWEMKSPSERDLQKHHAQILLYWTRMRPRYMVLCNFHEFWVYDTDEDDGQFAPKLKFPLTELPAREDDLLFLRGEEPDLTFRSERVTAALASDMGCFVRSLIEDHPDLSRESLAKFVLQCIFATFAEDAELIPGGVFTRALKEAVRVVRADPIFDLFAGFADPVRGRSYVNSPLFDETIQGIRLGPKQLQDLLAAKNYDWQDVHPEIFGTGSESQ